MNKEEFPSLYPESEQLLAEKLKMEKIDYEYLQFIRGAMRLIVERKTPQPKEDE